MKCQRCNLELDGKDTKCPRCGLLLTNEKLMPSDPFNFYGSCQVCGKEGRKLEIGEGKQKMIIYRCFECYMHEYNKERLSRLAREPRCISIKNQMIGTPEESKHWAPIEARYQKSITFYYLRPLFYKRIPNWKMLNKHSLELLKTLVGSAEKQIIEEYQAKEEKLLADAIVDI